MGRFLWTTSKIEKVGELYRAGEPRRIIRMELGCTVGELNVRSDKGQSND